jgi:hypothetical protein
LKGHIVCTPYVGYIPKKPKYSQNWPKKPKLTKKAKIKKKAKKKPKKSPKKAKIIQNLAFCQILAFLDFFFAYFWKI